MEHNQIKHDACLLYLLNTVPVQVVSLRTKNWQKVCSLRRNVTSIRMNRLGIALFRCQRHMSHCAKYGGIHTWKRLTTTPYRRAIYVSFEGDIRPKFYH